MNNNFELFKNLTKEEINNNLEWGDPYEFGTQYAKYLLKEKQELIDYLKEEINKINEQIEHFDLWHEVGVDINFLILKKQMLKEILSKIEKE